MLYTTAQTPSMRALARACAREEKCLVHAPLFLTRETIGVRQTIGVRNQSQLLADPFQTSQDLDRVGRHPDVNLLESGLQPLFELNEEVAVFGLIRDVYEDSDQVIAV